MKEQRFRSFDEFWPYFVRAHEKSATRALHFAGTTVAMTCVAGSLLLRKPVLLALAPLVSYVPAWAGHFFIEKNRPATAGYPLWSLKANLIMWSMTLAGTMDAEVDRVTASNGYHHEPASTRDALSSSLFEDQVARHARKSLN